MSLKNGPGPTHRADGGRARDLDRLGGAIEEAHSTPRVRLQHRASASVIRPDHVHAGMLRVETGGTLTDRVNLTRAQDAVAVILETEGRNAVAMPFFAADHGTRFAQDRAAVVTTAILQSARTILNEIRLDDE
jgi:hypothetical protein